MRAMLIAAAMIAATAAHANEPAAAARIAALEARVAALEARLAELEAVPPPPASGLPSDEEFERTLGFMETFMRRFMGLAREFERTPAPNRT